MPMTHEYQHTLGVRYFTELTSVSANMSWLYMIGIQHRYCNEIDPVPHDISLLHLHLTKSSRTLLPIS
jgi:hypothetical protein